MSKWALAVNKKNLPLKVLMGKSQGGRINVVGIPGECQILKKKGGFLGGFNLQKRN